MLKQELFIELFPIEPANLPRLIAYQAVFRALEVGETGGHLAYWLERKFPGKWVWIDDRIVTDTRPVAAQLQEAVTELREENPEGYAELEAIVEDDEWRPTALTIANFVARAYIRDIEPDIQAALREKSVMVHNARIERSYRLKTWDVQGIPSVSLSIKSQLIYSLNLQEYLATTGDSVLIAGLLARDRTSTLIGEALHITGTVGERRADLLQLTGREVMREILQDAPDQEKVILIRSGRREYEYPASALEIIIRMNNPSNLRQFKINRRQLARTLSLRPDIRANLVKVISDKLKNAGLINNAFNSLSHPDLFDAHEFAPQLLFADHQVEFSEPQRSGDEFKGKGIFKRHPRFQEGHIHVAVLDEVGALVDDFLEVLRRQLERDAGAQMKIVYKRRLAGRSIGDIEESMAALTRARPHILLMFLADNQEEAATGEDEGIFLRQLKTRTLANGIALQIIYPAAIHDPKSMTTVMMAVLAKTGNIPYVLARPLEFADFVVGLDILRERAQAGDRAMLLSRIYRNNGEFFRYFITQAEFEKDGPIPFIVMEHLFPQHIFEGKRMIIHHAGYFREDEVIMLRRWQKVLKAVFCPVEFLQWDIPRLYGLRDRQITHPPLGSFFRVSQKEAFVVTSIASSEATPMPLHLRILFDDLTIDQAIESALVWTLFHYGRPYSHKLPVTVQSAGELLSWFAAGILPENLEGDVPFWI